MATFKGEMELCRVVSEHDDVVCMIVRVLCVRCGEIVRHAPPTFGSNLWASEVGDNADQTCTVRPSTAVVHEVHTAHRLHCLQSRAAGAMIFQHTADTHSSTVPQFHLGKRIYNIYCDKRLNGLPTPAIGIFRNWKAGVSSLLCALCARGYWKGARPTGILTNMHRYAKA